MNFRTCIRLSGVFAFLAVGSLQAAPIPGDSVHLENNGHNSPWDPRPDMKPEQPIEDALLASPQEHEEQQHGNLEEVE